MLDVKAAHHFVLQFDQRDQHFGRRITRHPRERNAEAKQAALGECPGDRVAAGERDERVVVAGAEDFALFSVANEIDRRLGGGQYAHIERGHTEDILLFQKAFALFDLAAVQLLTGILAGTARSEAPRIAYSSAG